MSVNIVTPAASAVVKFVKGEVTADLKRERIYADYVAEQGVTADKVAEHAALLTEVAYPGVKPSSRAERDSREGRANNFRNKVRNGLNRALATDEETDKPAVLRLSLSGEGGGSTVIPVDHPQYKALVALINGSTES